MAFTSTVSGSTVFGDKRVTFGTYAASGGATGGDINAGMTTVLSMDVTASGSAVVADAPTINETFPVAGSAVTVIVTADTTGYWFAFGK